MFTSKEVREKVASLVTSQDELSRKIQELEANLISVRLTAESKISEDEVQAKVLLDKISKALSDAEIKNSDINEVHDEINHILLDFRDNKTQLLSAIQLSLELLEKAKNLNQIQVELDSNQQKAIKAQADLQAFIAPSKQIADRITGLDTTVASTIKSIEAQKVVIDKNYSEIIETYNQIYGQEDGSGSKKEGLRDKLEISYQDLNRKVIEFNDKLESIQQKNIERVDTFISESQIQANELIKNIRSYLPEGVSAGLAGAFHEKKIEEKDAMHKNFRYFIWLIIGMIILGGIPVGVYFNMFLNGKPFAEIIKLVPNMTLSLAPLYIPCVWLAIHLNKNINLNKKLIEEYAYKEAINKTFVGVTEQINTLKDEKISEDIQTQLIKLIILANSDNPGRYITGYNDSENPIFQLLSALGDAGNNISVNTTIDASKKTATSEDTEKEQAQTASTATKK